MSISDTAQSPHVTLRGLPLNAVRWTHGFWADRVRVCNTSTIPAMGELMQTTERVKFLGNFEVAAGLIEGRHRGPRWNDGDFYKWLEAACASLVANPNDALASWIDEAIELIRKTQREDGYIHTDIQIRMNAGEQVTAFDNPLDFEMYNMGHLISAAIVHHRATGNTSLLAIAEKAADFLDRTFASPTPKQARHGICPSHLMGLIEFSRHTGKTKYRDLAKRLLEMRDLVTDGDDDNLDRIPFKQHTVAHGHAVRGTYLYAGAADIFAETGDATIFTPLEKVWNDLTRTKLYITGGCGALFDGASPDGSTDQKNITRVHQAFGRSYQLPNSTAHNETCAAIGNLMWNWRMLQITGEAKYADLVEHTLFNSMLAGVSLDGVSFFYTNTLRQLNPMPVELRWNRRRQKVLGCFCCPPNVARTLTELSHYAYLASDDAVSVILYGSNQLNATLKNGVQVRIRQDTQYPWDGNIKLRIEHPATFELRLRIPAWSDQSIVKVNGMMFPANASPESFVNIRRDWRAGDVVEVQLDVTPRLMQANPFVEEARNHLAVQAGPIVYCVESIDLPAGVKLQDVRISHGATFERAAGTDALAGIGILKCRLQGQISAGFNATLYHRAAPPKRETFDAVLIPYFAWDNRGASEMTVWIPSAD